jgi:hypothetical protein
MLRGMVRRGEERETEGEREETKGNKNKKNICIKKRRKERKLAECPYIQTPDSIIQSVGALCLFYPGGFVGSIQQLQNPGYTQGIRMKVMGMSE